ncbi:hypothetical protein [uncultured Cohaesibacter sp.]|uniref:hypothetical protein n=1 Tax=uncultured Cohaesibacter sp. TaxID=1002546 RepID=UPI002A0A1AA9|nr:hypothetical protein [uncultured Cohaesibacter sp.]
MIKDSKKLAKDRFDATQKAKKEALSEYETQSLITREKTARLRALRLANTNETAASEAPKPTRQSRKRK